MTVLIVLLTTFVLPVKMDIFWKIMFVLLIQLQESALNGLTLRLIAKMTALLLKVLNFCVFGGTETLNLTKQKHTVTPGKCWLLLLLVILLTVLAAQLKIFVLLAILVITWLTMYV